MKDREPNFLWKSGSFMTFLYAFEIPPCHGRDNFLVQISEAGKNVSKNLHTIITVNSIWKVSYRI